MWMCESTSIMLARHACVSLLFTEDNAFAYVILGTSVWMYTAYLADEESLLTDKNTCIYSIFPMLSTCFLCTYTYPNIHVYSMSGRWGEPAHWGQHVDQEACTADWEVHRVELPHGENVGVNTWCACAGIIVIRINMCNHFRVFV